MDRIEYLATKVGDHCEDGDEIARRQQQERIAHYNKTQNLLDLARRMVELLEGDLARFARSIPQAEEPPRIGPGGRVGQNTNGDSPPATTGPTRSVSSR